MLDERKRLWPMLSWSKVGLLSVMFYRVRIVVRIDVCLM